VAARILLVEDDYLVALEVEHHLTAAGFSVVGIARTAEQAITMASEEKPDLAVVDIRLAGLRDGIDAASEMLLKSGISSIFASAHGDLATRQRAERAKPVGWLTKPYALTSLIVMIRSVLAQRS
jgi:DNA-binding response OmpR family regulator